MEIEVIKELYREKEYEKISELCIHMDANNIEDATIVLLIAESFRKLEKWRLCIKWTEWLVQLNPKRNNLIKLKDLYLQEGASVDQWQELMKASKDNSDEVYVISHYFYEKEKGADIEILENLCEIMMSRIAYEDSIYFEVAELYGKAKSWEKQRYFLEQIQTHTNDEQNGRKAMEMLRKYDSSSEEILSEELKMQRVERKVPAEVEKYFTDVIGMQNIKEELGALYHYLHMEKTSEDKIAVPYNFVIAGQSGSGKTKLAKIIVKMLYEQGLTDEEEAVEVNALSIMEDLSILEEAQVVIINNAECMCESANGEEKGDGENKIWLALEPLLEEACEDRKHFYLFLGEADAMEKLMLSNSKLKKYFTYLKIPVYSVKELHQIGLQMI